MSPSVDTAEILGNNLSRKKKTLITLIVLGLLAAVGVTVTLVLVLKGKHDDPHPHPPLVFNPYQVLGDQSPQSSSFVVTRNASLEDVYYPFKENNEINNTYFDKV